MAHETEHPLKGQVATVHPKLEFGSLTEEAQFEVIDWVDRVQAVWTAEDDLSAKVARIQVMAVADENVVLGLIDDEKFLVHQSELGE